MWVVAGLYSDKDLRRASVFTEDERFEILKGVRFVDDIVKNAPTDFNPSMLMDFSCDYAILGIKDTDRKTESVSFYYFSLMNIIYQEMLI